MHPYGDLLMGEGQVDVFFCAHCCFDVLSLVVKLVVAVLSTCDQLRHWAMLDMKIHIYYIYIYTCGLMLMVTFMSQGLTYEGLH